jgi:hypothetical protein
MALKLKAQKKLVRIDYKEDNTNPVSENNKVLASFWIEIPTPSDIDKMMEKAQEEHWLRPNDKTKPELHMKTNWLTYVHLKIKKMIKKWEGLEFEDENGIVVDASPECNDENKIKAYENNPEVINWVLEQVDEIQKIEAEKREVRRKN